MVSLAATTSYLLLALWLILSFFQDLASRSFTGPLLLFSLLHKLTRRWSCSGDEMDGEEADRHLREDADFHSGQQEFALVAMCRRQPWVNPSAHGISTKPFRLSPNGYPRSRSLYLVLRFPEGACESTGYKKGSRVAQFGMGKTEEV
jgi:hypothetical protein